MILASPPTILQTIPYFWVDARGRSINRNKKVTDQNEGRSIMVLYFITYSSK
jgi:hypothetical protein